MTFENIIVFSDTPSERFLLDVLICLIFLFGFVVIGVDFGFGDLLWLWFVTSLAMSVQPMKREQYVYI